MFITFDPLEMTKSLFYVKLARDFVYRFLSMHQFFFRPNTFPLFLKHKHQAHSWTIITKRVLEDPIHYSISLSTTWAKMKWSGRSRASEIGARSSCTNPSADFEEFIKTRTVGLKLNALLEKRNLRATTVARVSAWFAKERRGEFANPSMRVPEELRHAQAIAPSTVQVTWGPPISASGAPCFGGIHSGGEFVSRVSRLQVHSFCLCTYVMKDTSFPSSNSSFFLFIYLYFLIGKSSFKTYYYLRSKSKTFFPWHY